MCIEIPDLSIKKKWGIIQIGSYKLSLIMVKMQIELPAFLRRKNDLLLPIRRNCIERERQSNAPIKAFLIVM